MTTLVANSSLPLNYVPSLITTYSFSTLSSYSLKQKIGSNHAVNLNTCKVLMCGRVELAVTDMCSVHTDDESVIPVTASFLLTGCHQDHPEGQSVWLG